jgi:hypothetical protein
MPSSGADTTRHIELAGCFNFRDLGGYRTVDGRVTRWRRLFRADGLDALEDGDREALAGLGIRTVIDLRTDMEATRRLTTEPGEDDAPRAVGTFPGATYHHLPLTEVLPGEEDAPHWEDPRFVSERYGGMLRDGSASVVHALRLLSSSDRLPAVFHCSVGKDRTGVLAAVVLGLLGVPDDVIVDDYTLSRRAMIRLLGVLRQRYPDASEIVDRYEPVILSVEPASMEGFLAEVRARHGSFEQLALDLGVTDVAARLREELLEEPGEGARRG